MGDVKLIVLQEIVARGEPRTIRIHVRSEERKDIATAMLIGTASGSASTASGGGLHDLGGGLGGHPGEALGATLAK